MSSENSFDDTVLSTEGDVSGKEIAERFVCLGRRVE